MQSIHLSDVGVIDLIFCNNPSHRAYDVCRRFSVVVSTETTIFLSQDLIQWYRLWLSPFSTRTRLMALIILVGLMKLRRKNWKTTMICLRRSKPLLPMETSQILQFSLSTTKPAITDDKYFQHSLGVKLAHLMVSVLITEWVCIHSL